MCRILVKKIDRLQKRNKYEVLYTKRSRVLYHTILYGMSPSMHKSFYIYFNKAVD